MAKITLEEIKDQLNNEGWKVLSETYKNLNEEMSFKCPEGHEVYAPWKKLRGSLICPVCQANSYKNIESTITAKKKGTKRILALDQASHVSGWSIYDGLELIKFGSFEASGFTEIERYDSVKNWLVSMLSNWKPDHVALEGIQYQEKFGVTTFETLARLQGILMECCYEMRIPFTICPTNTWRHHCGVKGKSRTDKKRSMQLLIKEWFDISVIDDIADAIGIGKYAADLINKTEVVSWE